MKSCIIKIIILVLIFFHFASLLCYAIPPPVFDLDIYVKNLDTKDYYLDVLVEYNDEFYSRFNNEYDSSLKDSQLYKYRDGEWMAFFIREQWSDNEVAFKGKDTFESNVRFHSFMSTFINNRKMKAIVQDTKGNLYISSNYIKFDGSSPYIFDVKTGELQKINRYYEMYINRNLNYSVLIVSLIFIIISKLLISILFKIKPKLLVVLISAFSQIAILAVILTLYSLTLFNYILMSFIIAWLLTLLLEFILYKKFTKNANPKRLCFFVILSNILTCMMSYGVNTL
jgi:hypothetical protein